MAKAAQQDDDSDGGVLSPRRNAELIGQDAAAQALYADFSAGKLAHGWMLTGPKGIGKATLAHRFARYVLANGIGDNDGPSLFGEALPNDDPADPLYIAPGDPVFQRISAGGHSDFLCLERGLNSTGKLRSEIVVEDVRNAIRFLGMTAGEGGWRVVIVDSADDLNPNAANALLKVLEEPPAHALLLLVCHNPGRLLPTIRSRCRKLRLQELNETRLMALMETHLPETSVGERQKLMSLADGSIGRALELASADGTGLHDSIMSLLAQMPTPSVPEIQAFGAGFAKTDGVARFDTLADLLRRSLNQIIQRASGHTATVKTTESDVINRLAQMGSLDRWLEVWEKTDDLLGRTNRINLDRKQVILNIFLNISKAASG